MSIKTLLSNIDDLLIQLQPNEIELIRRKQHEVSLKASLKSNFGAESFAISASLNHTLLPNEAIELTQLLPKKQCDKWCSLVNKALCQEASSEYSNNEQTSFDDSRISCSAKISASLSNAANDTPTPKIDIDSIRHSIKNNYVTTEIGNCTFRLSPNNLSSLFMCAILEEADASIGNDHLLKRSLMLIKAWCLYESTMFSYKSISKLFGYESLVVIVLWLFSSRDQRHHPIDHPFRALMYFLEEMSVLDWERFYITTTGLEPVSGSSTETFGGGLKPGCTVGSTGERVSGEPPSLLQLNIANIVDTYRTRYESFFVDESSCGEEGERSGGVTVSNSFNGGQRDSFTMRDSTGNELRDSVATTDLQVVGNRDRLDSSNSILSTGSGGRSSASTKGSRPSSPGGAGSPLSPNDAFNSTSISPNTSGQGGSGSQNMSPVTPIQSGVGAAGLGRRFEPVNGMVVLDPIDPTNNLVLSENACSFLCKDMVRKVFKRGLRGTRQMLNQIIRSPATTPTVAPTNLANQVMPLTIQMIKARQFNIAMEVKTQKEQSERMKSLQTYQNSLNFKTSFGGLFGETFTPGGQEEADANVAQEKEAEFKFDLNTPISDVESIIRHAELVSSTKITAESIINLVIQVLNQYGPLPIGEIGKQLQTKTGNPEFPKVLKKAFSGLKKFISSYPNLFKFGDNHNFNPLVYVVNTGDPNHVKNNSTVTPHFFMHTQQQQQLQQIMNSHTHPKYPSRQNSLDGGGASLVSSLYSNSRQNSSDSIGSSSVASLRNQHRSHTKPTSPPPDHFNHYHNNDFSGSSAQQNYSLGGSSMLGGDDAIPSRRGKGYIQQRASLGSLTGSDQQQQAPGGVRSLSMPNAGQVAADLQREFGNSQGGRSTSVDNNNSSSGSVADSRGHQQWPDGIVVGVPTGPSQHQPHDAFAMGSRFSRMSEDVDFGMANRMQERLSDISEHDTSGRSFPTGPGPGDGESAGGRKGSLW